MNNLSPRLQYARLYRSFYPGITLCILLSTAQSFLLLAIAYQVRRVFDEAIPAKNLTLLVSLGALIFFANVVGEGMAVLIRNRILNISKLVTQRLRHQLLEKVLNLPLAYFGKADHARLHNNIVQDTERVDVMGSAFLAMFLPACLTSLVLLTLLAVIDWQLFLVVIITAPFLLFLSKSVGRSLRHRVRTFHASFENFSKGTLFLIQMVESIRIHSADLFEADRQKRNIEDLRLRSSSMVRQQNLYILVQNGIVAISSVIILIVGGWAITQGRMTLGQLLSFYVGLALLRNQLNTIATTLPQLIVGNESLRTLFDFLNLEQTPVYSGSRKIQFGGQISFESVNFGYEEHEVLLDINLTMDPHSVNILTGMNGAGKTTIGNLILGHYRPQHGRLLADGISFDDLDMLHLRAFIGVVPQDPVIFLGTVWENISYGLPEVKFEEVVQAAKNACAHQFIQELPSGYETIVGEKGMLLSGGQRQRLAIARALLRRPTLLLMDEPTNHLDRETMTSVIEHLQNIEGRPTTLIISHEREMMNYAQRAYAIHDSRLKLIRELTTVA
jgi:ATP-binding cassette subfamily B protein